MIVGSYIPQRTVDNNPWPGQMAVDLNYCIHNLSLKVLTVHCYNLRLFWAKAMTSNCAMCYATVASLLVGY